MAQRLMTEYDWNIIISDMHTMVCCPEHQLIWDPTYAAMQVSAQSKLHTVFGEELDGTDYEFCQPEEFEWSEHTKYVLHIWKLIDSAPEDKHLSIIEGMGDKLDEMRTVDKVDERELVAA